MFFLTTPNAVSTLSISVSPYEPGDFLKRIAVTQPGGKTIVFIFTSR